MPPRETPLSTRQNGSSPAEPIESAAAAKVPLLDALIEYQKKGVGVDMFLKSILGIFRLCMIYSSCPRNRKIYANVVDAIIECRMLCNFGRPAMTLRQGLKAAAATDKFGFCHWLFLVLSYFLRVPEQMSGDLNYMQKVVFHNWSRERLSFYYRFFKSLSLTCCVVSELSRRPALQAALAKAKTPGEVEKARLDVRICHVLLVRTLCDMYVYYKWVPGYTPYKTLEFICGSVSGILGVWMVWRDTRYVKPCAGAVAAAACDPAGCSGDRSLGRVTSMSLNEGGEGGEGDGSGSGASGGDE